MSEDYFHMDVCLFCDQKAQERFYGNHGRESENVCSCEGRKAWEAAKEALLKVEELPMLKLRRILQKASYRERDIKSTEAKADLERTEIAILHLLTKGHS